MPGLLRGVARTAVIAGTASSVAGRVNHRQQQKWAQQEQPQQEQPQQYYAAPPQQQYAPPPPPPPPVDDEPDMFEQLKKLGELRDQGILTDEEFAAQKAKVLGS